MFEFIKYKKRPHEIHEANLLLWLSHREFWDNS